MSRPIIFFHKFTEDLANKVHNLKTGSTDVFMVALTNTQPVKTNSLLSHITEIAAGNGYTAGGRTIGAAVGSQTNGRFLFRGASNVVFTASGGSMSPWRWAVLYNSTPTSPLKPLIGWWDYQAAQTIIVGRPFTIPTATSKGIFVFGG